MSTKAVVVKSDGYNKHHMSGDGSDDPLLCTGQCRSQFSTSKGRRDIFIKNFAVKPNKEEYRVIKDDNFMLEFDGSTTFRKVSIKDNGFVRYPLKLVDLDAIEPIDNKYLIDVAGYVSNIGRTNHLESGSKNLDFHLANHRGHSIRVALWGNLRELLVEKNKHVGVCPIVLTSTIPKIYNNKVYLSSTSSIMILDDVKIPTIKAMKDTNSGMELKNPYMPIDLTRPVKETIENLLMWARNRKNNVYSFIYSVIWTKTGWNFPSCGSKDCKKSITRKKDYFYCESCNMRVDFSMLSYKLELDVSNNTSQTVIVMFDKTATALVGCSAGSLIDIKDEEGGDESVGSSTLDALADVQPPRLNSLVPSKPLKSKRTKSLVIEDSDVEASGDSSGYAGKNVADPLSDNNKRKRELIDVSTDDVSGNTPPDGSTDQTGSQSDRKKG
nr:hypothetical protein [Tanacetum cinerariifolium]